VNNKNSTNRYRFQFESERGGMMEIELIDVNPQGRGRFRYSKHATTKNRLLSFVKVCL